MLEDFLSYIKADLSIDLNDKILLSISGGVDSMVMLDLFVQSGCQIVVAHIDHSTRKGQSKKDKEFVESVCAQKEIPFHSTTLDSEVLKKGNFQQNAREARKDFLAHIADNTSCKWIATAHHLEDRWETFLMHLNRKSGLRGLTSLRSREGNYIRPLMAFTKAQIKSCDS